MELGSFSPLLAKPQPVVIEGERPSDIAAQRVVHFADLDLGTQQGRDRLTRRVRYTIEDLCSNDEFRSTLNPPDLDCEREGWSSATPQLQAVLRQGASSLTAATLVVTVRR
jgi:UrcA family protein